MSDSQDQFALSRRQLLLGAPLGLAAGISTSPGESATLSKPKIQKMALLIANQHYISFNELRTPKADVALIAEVLKKIGFDVSVEHDLRQDNFLKTVQSFAKRLSELDAPIVFFHYAGHGSQIDARTYFYPVDMPTSNNKSSLVLDGVDVNMIVDWIEKGNPKGKNFLFLDGCRNNPLEDNLNLSPEMERELPKGVIGLGRLGDNTTVIYSTAPGIESIEFISMPGRPTYDQSPFARAVASSLSMPDLNFDDFFTRIQNAVLDETLGRQKPAKFGNVPSKFYIGRADPLQNRPGPVTAIDRARRVAVGFDSDGEPVYVYSGSYALFIGVSHYGQNASKMFDQKNWNDLPGVENDIQHVDTALRNYHGFETTIVKNPTQSRMQEALKDFFSVHGRKDNARLIIYYAGHGYTTENYGRHIGWVVPTDAPNPKRAPEEFALSAFSMRRIEEFSEFVKAKHILWIFDSCFSGSIFEMGMRGMKDATFEEKLYSKPMRRVITSGSENEEVPDRSIFAEMFVEALEGKRKVGAQKDLFTAYELGEHLHREVYSYMRGLQTPQNGTILLKNLREGEIVFRVEEQLQATR